MAAHDRSGFEVLEILDPAAIVQLEAEYGQILGKLHARYLPEIETSRGYLANADYLDGLRIAWLVDKRWFKPGRKVSSRALGYALGKLLADVCDMKWCRIKDGYGEFNVHGVLQ
jgi:hypothetical protein